MGSAEATLGSAGATAAALFNVSLVLRGHAERLSGAVPLQAPELAPLWAAAIPEVAPRVELRRAARVVPDAEAELEKETAAEARAEVLLESPPPAASRAGELYEGEDTAKLVADAPEGIAIETGSREERYLVLADRFYPGWFARVDGQEVEVLRAYGVLRALRLGPGRHRVTFEFWPQSVRRGIAVTGASALLLLLLGLVRRRL
jgi:hypothetical protein